MHLRLSREQGPIVVDLTNHLPNWKLYSSQAHPAFAHPMTSLLRTPCHSSDLLALNSVILSIVFTFHRQLNLFHLLCLSIPLCGGHFRLLLEQLLIGGSVATSQSIPERSILTIVEVKI